MSVKPNSMFPGQRAFATILISTNADGFTGGDIVDLNGGVMCGLELAAGNADAQYSLQASAVSSDTLKTVIGSTGNVLTFGTSAATNTPGRFIAISPDLLRGARFIRLVSGTTATPNLQTAGASAVLHCVSGPSL
jgi:hypothetical protein